MHHSQQHAAFKPSLGVTGVHVQVIACISTCNRNQSYWPCPPKIVSEWEWWRVPTSASSDRRTTGVPCSRESEVARLRRQRRRQPQPAAGCHLQEGPQRWHPTKPSARADSGLEAGCSVAAALSEPLRGAAEHSLVEAPLGCVPRSCSADLSSVLGCTWPCGVHIWPLSVMFLPMLYLCFTYV